MKLEGEDRERPGDDLTIFIGVPAMLACQMAAWVSSTTDWSAMLVALVSCYCTSVINPMLRADTARIKRHTQQMEQEIARIDAKMERIDREAKLAEIERRVREGE